MEKNKIILDLLRQLNGVYPANTSTQASVEMAVSYRQVNQSCDGSKAAKVCRNEVAILHLVGRTSSPGREPKGLAEERRAGRILRSIGYVCFPACFEGSEQYLPRLTRSEPSSNGSQEKGE